MSETYRLTAEDQPFDFVYAAGRPEPFVELIEEPTVPGGPTYFVVRSYSEELVPCSVTGQMVPARSSKRITEDPASAHNCFVIATGGIVPRSLEGKV